MPHMLLIAEPLGQREERGPVAGAQAYQAMLGLTVQLKAAGVLLASSALSTPATRLQLQSRNGQPRWVDGPFADAREMQRGLRRHRRRRLDAPGPVRRRSAPGAVAVCAGTRRQ